MSSPKAPAKGFSLRTAANSSQPLKTFFQLLQTNVFSSNSQIPYKTPTQYSHKVTTSKNTTNHKNKRKSIVKLFHAQTGSIWFQISSYLVPMGSLVHRSVTNLKMGFLTVHLHIHCSKTGLKMFKWVQGGSVHCTSSHQTFTQNGLRMTQVDQSWGLFDCRFFNATGEDFGVQDQCFTAPKMRFCSDLFCQTGAAFTNSSTFESPEGTTVYHCYTINHCQGTPTIVKCRFESP